mmetsp:Transcript_18381/g.47106  ORF Transcript_18381/g.47106 Transcript_18381/m.47106 type:complete len:498 (+) Transcript_18381:109-1602(+)
MRMILREIHPRFHGPVVLIQNGLVDLPGGDKVEGGEAVHLEPLGLVVVCSVVHGDLQRLHPRFLRRQGELLPVRLRRLAMPAPRRMKHDEMILVPLPHDLLEVLPHQVLQRSRICGDRLRLHVCLQLPGLQLGQEQADGLLVRPHATGFHPLGHAVSLAVHQGGDGLAVGDDGAKLLVELGLLAGDVANVEIEVGFKSGDALFEAVDNVDELLEAHIKVLVHLCVQHNHRLRKLLRKHPQTVIQQLNRRQIRGRDLGKRILIRELLPRQPDDHRILLAQGGLVPHKKHRVGLAEGAGQGGGGPGESEVHCLVFGGLPECRSPRRILTLEHPQHAHALVLHKRRHLLRRGELLDGPQLGPHEIDDVLDLPPVGVLRALLGAAAAEKEQRREARDPKPLRQRLVLFYVHVEHTDTLRHQRLSGEVELPLQVPAVPAPRGGKLHQGDLLIVHGGVERLLRERPDIFRGPASPDVFPLPEDESRHGAQDGGSHGARSRGTN